MTEIEKNHFANLNENERFRSRSSMIANAIGERWVWGTKDRHVTKTAPHRSLPNHRGWEGRAIYSCDHLNIVIKLIFTNSGTIRHEIFSSKTYNLNLTELLDLTGS